MNSAPRNSATLEAEIDEDLRESHRPAYDPTSVFLSWPDRNKEQRELSEAFHTARDTYVKALVLHRHRPDEKMRERARGKYEQALANLLTYAVEYRRKQHGFVYGANQRNDAYERDIDELWDAFFTKGDARIMAEGGSGENAQMFIREPRLALAFGKRALAFVKSEWKTVNGKDEQVDTPETRPLRVILGSSANEFQSSSEQFAKIRERFDTARGEYLSAYHLHLEQISNINAANMVGLAGLHRGAIRALGGERERYRKARSELLLYVKRTGLDPEQKSRDMMEFLMNEERSFIEVRRASLNRMREGALDKMVRAYAKMPFYLRPVISAALIGVIAGGVAGAAGAAIPAALGAGGVAASVALKRTAVSMLAGFGAAAAMNFAFRLGEKAQGEPSMEAVEESAFAGTDASFLAQIEERADEVFKNENRQDRQDLARRLVSVLAGAGAAGVFAAFTPDAALGSDAPSPTVESPPETPPTPPVEMPTVTTAEVDLGDGAIATFKEFLASPSNAHAQFEPMLRGIGVDTTLSPADQADQLARELGFLTRAGESPVIPEGASFEFNETEGLTIKYADGSSDPLIEPGAAAGTWTVNPYTP